MVMSASVGFSSIHFFDSTLYVINLHSGPREKEKLRSGKSDTREPPLGSIAFGEMSAIDHRGSSCVWGGLPGQGREMGMPLFATFLL